MVLRFLQLFLQSVFMVHSKKIIYGLIACLFVVGLLSCEQQPVPQNHIVVEGWIEQGKEPVVMIHQSYNLQSERNEEDTTLQNIATDIMIPFGKVTIDDGEKSVILTGRMDTNYMLPYIYTTVHMTGEVGRTYTLTVEYKDFYATATTTIPDVPHLDSITVKETSAAKMVVQAHMSDFPKNETAYYALFVREIGEQQFKLCPLGTFNTNNAIDGKIVINVRPQVVEIDKMAFPQTFEKREDKHQYYLKLARITEENYQFFDRYSAQISTQGIFFMPAYGNIPTNINGGLGYWNGMGASEYPFHIYGDTIYRCK